MLIEWNKLKVEYEGLKIKENINTLCTEHGRPLGHH
jgi:hypothetical protein